MKGHHDFKLGVQFNSGLGEYTYGLNDYIYTYGSTPAYGYTQLPYTQGGRMKALGIFADDAYQLGRATINVGVRYDNSKGYFAPQDLLDASGNPTGKQSAGRRPAVPVAGGVTAPRHQLQVDRQRVGAAESALRTLLSRDRHRRVRQHHTVDLPAVSVLRSVQRERSAARQGAGQRQLAI